MPVPLIAYVLAVLAVDVVLIGWELGSTRPRPEDLLLFAALMACGIVCIEATRRLGQPSGMSRDLLSAWWLPVALLLPPIYAQLAPVVLGLLLYMRGRRTPVYRRVFSSAALGLAGACASITFRWLSPRTRLSAPADWLSYPGPHAWYLRPQIAAVAVGCAVLFSVVNTCVVAFAAWLAEPDARLADLLWDRESLLLDLTELCVGTLVTIACALTPLLLCVALPPVVLLQRSLMHQQLQAAARTDAKTGLLNATAWQREADAEISRALRRGEQLGLLLIDVDHFKRVNDSHGHLTGDDVLRSLAAELRQQVRESDMVGRFGGEEFVILLPRTGVAEACRIAERLRRAAGFVDILVGDVTVSVTVSIGVAVLGRHGHALFELLAAADSALYQAKDGGRNQVRLHEPGPETGRVNTARQAADLRVADGPLPGREDAAGAAGGDAKPLTGRP